MPLTSTITTRAKAFKGGGSADSSSISLFSLSPTSSGSDPDNPDSLIWGSSDGHDDKKRKVEASSSITVKSVPSSVKTRPAKSKKKQKVEASSSITVESVPSSVETLSAKSKKEGGVTTVFVETAYGALLVPSDDPSKPPHFYESISAGAKSASRHIKAVRVRIPKEMKIIRFDDDILPVVIRSLLTMSVPVIFDNEKHNLMSPICLGDGSLTISIDKQQYHLLDLLNREMWRPTVQSQRVSVCVVPKSLTPKPSNTPKSNQPPPDTKAEASLKCLKVTFWYGAVRYGNNFLVDHKAREPRTRKLGDILIEYPITRPKLVEQVDELMLNGNAMSAFDEEFFVLLRETDEQAPSGRARKGSLPPTLPVAVDVLPSFIIKGHFTSKLNIIVCDKNMVDSASVSVGGKALSDAETNAYLAKKHVRDSIVVEVKKGKNLSCMHDLVLKGGVMHPVDLDQSAKELAEYAFNCMEKDDDTSKVHLQSKIMEYIDNLPRNQTTSDKLPSSACVASCVGLWHLRAASASSSQSLPLSSTSSTSTLPLSSTSSTAQTGGSFALACTSSSPSSSGDGGEGVSFLCRPRGDHDPSNSRSLNISKLTEILSKDIKMDIQCSEECGKDGHFKKGTWFNLLSINVGPQPKKQSTDTFVVQEVAQDNDELGKPSSPRLIKIEKFKEKGIAENWDDVELDE